MHQLRQERRSLRHGAKQARKICSHKGCTNIVQTRNAVKKDALGAQTRPLAEGYVGNMGGSEFTERAAVNDAPNMPRKVDRAKAAMMWSCYDVETLNVLLLGLDTRCANYRSNLVLFLSSDINSLNA